MQYAVDAEPDHESVVLGVEVEIAGAVFGRLEDDRVDQADERRVGHTVVGLEVVALAIVRLLQLVLDESRPLPGLRGADDAPELELDVLGGGDPDLERVPRGDAQLVDRLNVPRVRDGDVEPVVLELVRDGDRALEHVRRNGLGSSLVDSFRGKIDRRKVGMIGLNAPERARRGGRRRVRGRVGEPFVDERLGDRPGAGSRAGSSQPVSRNQAGRLEQVGDELRNRVRRDARPWRGGGLNGRGLLAFGGNAAQVGQVVELHLMLRPAELPRLWRAKSKPG